MGNQQGHTGGPPAVPPGLAPSTPAVGAGAPTTTPADGAMHVDTANSKLWVRVNGTWKSVTVS